jgi:hypothetical protein
MFNLAAAWLAAWCFRLDSAGIHADARCLLDLLSALLVSVGERQQLQPSKYSLQRQPFV